MAGKFYVVTGGGGFVGKALTKALLQRGDRVLSLARGTYPELNSLGATSVQVDIGSSIDSWGYLFDGADGVFHTAAKVDMWGKREGFFRTNVVGTRNVMEACLRYGAGRLVFTSSPSVIHDGSDLNGVDESYPYPAHFDAYYPETKAIAEREVLSAHRAGGLRTVALRPHLIWGPEDTNLIPTIIERARAGRLTRIGDGKNRVDLTFIDDCVRAHLLAMEALETRPEVVGGKVYFVSQGDPVELWTWIDEVLVANGLPKVSRSIPYRAAMSLACVMEIGGRMLSAFKCEFKPLLTRFLVSEMARNHYFDISRAKRDLGYSPSCTIREAMNRTFPHKAAA